MATANKNLSNYDKAYDSQMRKIFGLGLLFLNGIKPLQTDFFQAPKQHFSIVTRCLKTSLGGMFPEALNSSTVQKK